MKGFSKQEIKEFMAYQKFKKARRANKTQSVAFMDEDDISAEELSYQNHTRVGESSDDEDEQMSEA